MYNIANPTIKSIFSTKQSKTLISDKIINVEIIYVINKMKTRTIDTMMQHTTVKSGNPF